MPVAIRKEIFTWQLVALADSGSRNVTEVYRKHFNPCTCKGFYFGYAWQISYAYLQL